MQSAPYWGGVLSSCRLPCCHSTPCLGSRDGQLQDAPKSTVPLLGDGRAEQLRAPPWRGEEECHGDESSLPICCSLFLYAALPRSFPPTPLLSRAGTHGEERHIRH